MHENCFWAITTPDNTAIGFVGYHSFNYEKKQCSIAIHLNKIYWGRGITPIAVTSTDSYMFQNTEIEAIVATVKPENTQSQRCLTKAGYTMERIIDDYVSSATNDASRVRHFYRKQNNL